MFLVVVWPLLFVIIVIPVVILLYGITRWQSETVEIRKRLERGRTRTDVRRFDPDEIKDLPAPVQRYFRAVLPTGQPIIAVAEIAQRGEFKRDHAKADWVSFTAQQISVMQRPGFDWDARIRKLPGIQVFVHDSYVTGEARLKAALLGLWRAVEHNDTPELARSELTRFLAEAPWYPTRLLPSQGVHWTAIDDSSALATLQDGQTQASVTFLFEEDGMIRAARSDSRNRLEQGALVETPWEGSFSGYETRGGMRIPIHGEAAWLLAANGRDPFWRGQVTDVLYKFAS